MLRVPAQGGHLRDRSDAVGNLPPDTLEWDRRGLQGAVLRLRYVRSELRGDAQGRVRGQLPAVDTEPMGVGSVPLRHVEADARVLARQLERPPAGTADKKDPAEAGQLGRNGQAQLRRRSLRLNRNITMQTTTNNGSRQIS